MPNTFTLDDKFQRRLSVTATGDLKINPAAYKASEEVYENLRTENILKVSTEELGAGTSVEVFARMATQPAFTSLGTISGGSVKSFDISTWDHVKTSVTAYDGTPGFLAISAFFSPDSINDSNSDGIPDPSGGTGTIISDLDFDAVDTSYPSSTVEVYRYYTGGLSGTLLATVTITYQDADKCIIQSIVRT